MPRYVQSAATVPEPCMVFGTALRPFCLGHHLLFKRLKLPFCGDAIAPAGDDEILIGIAICAQSYENTLEQFLSGTWNKAFSKWRRELTKSFASRRFFFFHRKIEKSILSEAEALFRAYLQDGYERPPTWRYITRNGIGLSAPWEVILKNRLVMAGYSETEVLNGYLPGRWYDYFSVTELAAASNCADEKKWRKVFYTEDDAAIQNSIRKGAA